MSQNSKIEWTDTTWNPLRGCSRVSDGCMNCYAEKVAMRFSGAGQPYASLVRMTSQGPKWTGKIKLVPEALRAPFGWAKPRRVFVNSMSDLFHESVPFEFIASVFAVMSVTSRHTYQVLTKRPERMLEFFKWVKDGEGVFDDDRISNALPRDIPWIPYRENERHGGYDNCGPAFPYENVWLGVSVEDQKTADERISLLLQCPAAVHWISAEPLLGPIDLSTEWLAHRCGGEYPFPKLGVEHRTRILDLLDWVVVGGESGPGARPMHPAWVRSLRDQCSAADVPFLFKQWGEWLPGEENHGQFDPAPMHGYRRCDDHSYLWPSGRGRENFGTHPDRFSGPLITMRVGKKVAGRRLDGRTHDEFPEAR